jgi:predicted anti-sigma-YlaC factor YlaD
MVDARLTRGTRWARGAARRAGLLGALCLALALPGCSIKKMAINTVGNALAESGSTYASDDDPELIAAAVPFGLKTIESLLAESPKHKGLLLAACSGFTQYAYAFVQLPADYVEAQDLARATEMRARAKKLYLRAVDYGMRGFEVEFPGFRDQLRTNPDAALARTTKKHVPLLYYTAAAWAAAFAMDIADSQLSINQTQIEKMMTRALALDETWELGSLHDFFISWEAGHASAGGTIEKAREHYRRARELAAGKRIAPLLSYAESVLVSEQKKKEFVALLTEALEVDLAAAPPEQKLANVISQRRARWLLSRVDELF